ncbi:MAG TPA: tetratricopeptide repeat protein, partial [Gemmatimonadaceae bacterium]|nr:tetratricopeptide repeat protein [Gemmatimonadaceae bacterium]
MESTETRWQRHVDQGRLYVSQGNYAEAEQSLLAAVKEALTLGPADLRVASSLGILGKLKHRQGDRERAQGFLERALAVREEALGPDHYGVV